MAALPFLCNSPLNNQFYLPRLNIVFTLKSANVWQKYTIIMPFLHIKPSGVTIVLRTLSQGSILSTKNSQNSDKILRILTIFSDFQNVFLSKYSQENFQKSVQPTAPQYFVWKFLRISEKIWGFKILRFLSENFSELVILLIGLSPEWPGATCTKLD